MFNFEKLTLEDFITEIGSSKPVPGGGSLAAILLSLSGALAHKVCKVTKNNVFEDKFINSIVSIINDGNLLSNQDAQAYNQFILALRSKEDVEEALIKATKIPLEVSKHGLELLELTLLVIEKGNPNAITDALIASRLALLAVQGGILNMVVNLIHLKDSHIKSELVASYKEILNKYQSLELRVASEFKKYLLDVDKKL